MRKIWTHTDFLVGNVRRVLIAFTDDCGFFFFLQCGIYNHINMLSILCFIKIYCLLPCTLNGSFAYAYIHIYFNIKHWSFGRYWFTGYAKIPNGTALYSITFVSNTTYLIRKVFKDWETDKFTGEDKFSKIVIFVWKLRFNHCQQIQLDFASLEATSSFCSLSRKSLPDIQVRKTTVCLSVVLSSKNGDLWKKWLVQFSTPVVTQVLDLRQPSTLVPGRSASCDFLVHNEDVKQICTQRTRFDIITFFLLLHQVYL